MAIFRYPGGKTKLKKIILQYISEMEDHTFSEYREPFFGGGSIGLEIIKKKIFPSIWINDKDPALVCLWNSIIHFPHQLIRKIQSFTPTVDAFLDFKKNLLKLLSAPKDIDEVIEVGFQKLVVHQLSYSGLGTLAGPLGGKDQSSKYPIHCRWSPSTLEKKILREHKYLNSISLKYNECTNLDFEEVITLSDNPSVIYLDPPYYVQGNNLYQHGFTQDDHQRLAHLLSGSSHRWLLSYDECPPIHTLYNWAKKEILSVNYTIHGANNKNELLIVPKEVSCHPKKDIFLFQ